MVFCAFPVLFFSGKKTRELQGAVVQFAQVFGFLAIPMAFFGGVYLFTPGKKNRLEFCLVFMNDNWWETGGQVMPSWVEKVDFFIFI